MFKKVLSPDVKALHLMAFGLALGSNAWTTFFVGPISYANLPRQQFGNLMSVLFPSYFTFQAAATGIMVGTLAYQHAVIRKHPFDIMDATVYQAFTLATSTAACLINSLVVTPASSKLMYERHRQEKAEGKSYDDAGVSLVCSQSGAHFVATRAPFCPLLLTFASGLSPFSPSYLTLHRSPRASTVMRSSSPLLPPR